MKGGLVGQTRHRELDPGAVFLPGRRGAVQVALRGLDTRSGLVHSVEPGPVNPVELGQSVWPFGRAGSYPPPAEPVLTRYA